MGETQDHVTDAALRSRLSALEARTDTIFQELQLVGGKVDTVLIELRSRTDPDEHVVELRKRVDRMRLVQRIAIPATIGAVAVLFGVPPETIAKACASVFGWL